VYTVLFTAYTLGGNSGSTVVCSVNNAISSSTSFKLSDSRAVWKNYSFVFAATSTSTTLTCKLTTSAGGSVYLDDFSVMC
jgi:hypothetical protein